MMKTLLKHVLITPRNYPRIYSRIVPQDQREAIRAGIIVSHYTFNTRLGQTGYVIVSHTTRRAGISFAGEPTQWGVWSEETGTIQTDGGRLYSRVGELVFEAVTQTEERP
jgi:hypothetical protein